VGSLYDKAEEACFFTPIFMLPFLLFAGFLTNVDTFPKWIGWIQYTSPIRYGFEAGMWNEF
jgi:ABC-type multidrug transport system permease subunit